MEEWDIVTISYVGSSNTIFRTSQEYVYYDGSLKPYTDELKELKLMLEGMEETETETIEETVETVAETENVTNN